LNVSYNKVKIVNSEKLNGNNRQSITKRS
jgi:hypothetical protein